MTNEQKRKSLMAKIHVAKSQLKMDDDTYRAMLLNITGRASCVTLNLVQLQRVLSHLEERGFKATRKHLGKKPMHFVDKTPMMNKLSVLLANYNKSWAYADGMAKRMFQKERVQFLNADELRRLIAALNYAVLREQAKQALTLG